MSFRSLNLLLKAVILVLALHIFLIMFTGGYTFTIYGIAIKREKLALPTILLLLVVMLRCSFRRRLRFWESLSSHPAPLLLSLCLIIYLANGKTLGASDTIAA